MSRRKAITNVLYPFSSEYPTNYIRTYYTLNKELKNIIEGSGYKKVFLKKYQKSLVFLEKLKIRCVVHSNLFEKLLEENGLYSIRLFGEKNIRILFSFVTINGEAKVILLNVFEEKSKSDYEIGKRIARERKKEIIDIFNDGE